MKVDRLIRKFVPNTAWVSRNPLFYLYSLLSDLTVGTFMRRLARKPLPPHRYQVRTGVGNAIFLPHLFYLRGGVTDYWLWLFAHGYANLSSHIVDIGSGNGKTAAPLRDFAYMQDRFTGHYHGFDVDKGMVEWCCNNFPSDRFAFTHVNMPSRVYNPGGTSQANLQYPDGEADLVISNSLMSHLLEHDVIGYLRESSRVLKTGGIAMHTFFCLEDMTTLSLIGDRWTFRFKRGAAYIENERFPESAVAYEKKWMMDCAKAAGFSKIDVILPGYQSTLIAIK